MFRLAQEKPCRHRGKGLAGSRTRGRRRRTGTGEDQQRSDPLTTKGVGGAMRRERRNGAASPPGNEQRATGEPNTSVAKIAAVGSALGRFVRGCRTSGCHYVPFARCDGTRSTMRRANGMKCRHHCCVAARAFQNCSGPTGKPGANIVKCEWSRVSVPRTRQRK